jgi:uncharacterized protein YjiS (DUF1127 family)
MVTSRLDSAATHSGKSFKRPTDAARAAGRRLVPAFRHWLWRRAEERPETLSDHVLRDIGISRSTIACLAEQGAPRVRQ